jgi:hypothetical protein
MTSFRGAELSDSKPPCGRNVQNMRSSLDNKAENEGRIIRESDSVAIVILIMNQWEKTRNCLESLHDSEGKAPPILLWDNGCRS